MIYRVENEAFQGTLREWLRSAQKGFNGFRLNKHASQLS